MIDKKEGLLEKILDFMDTGTYYIGKDKDDLGRTLIFLFLGRRNPQLYEHHDFLSVLTFLCTSLAISDKQAQIIGTVAITDFKNVGFKHLLSPNELKASLALVNINFFREKQTILWNMNAIVTPMVKVGKLFLSEKMKNRIEIITGFEGLQTMIKPKSILPTEFGGDVYSEREMIEYSKDIIKRNFDLVYDIFTVKYDDDVILEKLGVNMKDVRKSLMMD